MLKYIEIINKSNEKIHIPFALDYDCGFFVTKMTGVGPVKPSISTTSLSGRPGVIINGVDFQSRNIVISLQFLGIDIEAVRKRCYRIMSVGEYVTFIVKTDKGLYKTTGVVESNDPSIFSSNEGADISIICADPYFIDMSDDNAIKYVIMSDTEPKFEFPFELQNNTIFSESVPKRSIVLDYKGTVRTGFIIRFLFHSVNIGDHIQISKEETNELMYFDTNKIEEIAGINEIFQGDELVINTNPENREIYFIDNGARTDMYGAVDPGESWFTLSPGLNTFVYETQYNWEDVDISFEYSLKVNGI